LVYRWSPGYTSPDGKEQNIYEYDAPGFYKVGVTRQVISVAKGRKASVKLDKTDKSSEDIEVVVEGREADGTYEGKMLVTSLRFITEEGATTANLLTSPVAPIPFELVVKGDSSTVSILFPGDKIPVGIKDAILSNQFSAVNKAPILRGEFSALNRGIFMDKIEKTYFREAPSGQDGLKKYEASMKGYLIGADSAKGEWQAYFAYRGSMEVPIDQDGNTKISTEMMSIRMTGSWRAKLKTDPLQPKPLSTGSTLKSKTKNPSSTGTAPKSGKK
jgi:hypothetical protein